jgi:hypothetical protein
MEFNACLMHMVWRQLPVILDYALVDLVDRRTIGMVE